MEKKDNAVSPVVGVMLMLVVTIVIAALVAAFAGGIGGNVDTDKVKVITADATFSVSNGLLIKSTNTNGLIYNASFDIYVNKPSDRNSFWKMNASKANNWNKGGIAFSSGNAIYFNPDNFGSAYREAVSGSKSENDGGSWLAAGWDPSLLGQKMTVQLRGTDGSVLAELHPVVTV